MKCSNLLLSAAFGISIALYPLPLRAAASDAEVSAHKTALDLAGAFGNEGFKLRDGVWSSLFEKGKSHVIQVNLYAGNQYYFSLGAALPAKRVTMSVYDETGHPVDAALSDEGLPVASGAAAVTGFSPDASGPYFIKVEELEGEPAAFCLLYSYK